MALKKITSAISRMRRPNTNTQATHVNHRLFGGWTGLGLAVIVMYNIILLILGAAVAHNVSWRDYVSNHTSVRTKLYFFYCILPAVATAYSLLEFGLNWGGKLRAMQVLVTAPMFILLYILSYCAYSTTAFCYIDDPTPLTCILHMMVGVDKFYDEETSDPDLMNRIGVADIVAAIIYAIYFICAAVVMHRRRATQRALPLKIDGNEPAYSLSTMPASTSYNVATPSNFYGSQPLPAYSDRLSRVADGRSRSSQYSGEEAPRKA